MAFFSGRRNRERREEEEETERDAVIQRLIGLAEADRLVGFDVAD